MLDHLWHFDTDRPQGYTRLGPVSEDKLLELATRGAIGLRTMVFSPTRTGGHWMVACLVPHLVKAIELGKELRREHAFWDRADG